MADITMCKGGECPCKENCYRFKAIPGEYRQAYFMNAPYEENGCKYFIAMDKPPKKPRKRKTDE